MAFLQAPQPGWALELGAIGGEVCEHLAAAVPGSSGWFVRSDAFGRVLLASVNHTSASKRATVLAAAVVLAPLWPDWLAASAVGCRVWLPGFSIEVDAEAMVALAEGRLSGAEWWMAGEVRLG